MRPLPLPSAVRDLATEATLALRQASPADLLNAAILTPASFLAIELLFTLGRSLLYWGLALWAIALLLVALAKAIARLRDIERWPGVRSALLENSVLRGHRQLEALSQTLIAMDIWLRLGEDFRKPRLGWRLRRNKVQVHCQVRRGGTDYRYIFAVPRAEWPWPLRRDQASKTDLQEIVFKLRSDYTTAQIYPNPSKF
jgi:hypothetical protein